MLLLLLSLLPLLTTILATPITAPTTALAAGDLLFCLGPNWDACSTVTPVRKNNTTTCNDLNARLPGWENMVSGLKTNGQECMLYGQRRCKGKRYLVDGDVSQLPAEWDNQVRSFLCGISGVLRTR